VAALADAGHRAATLVAELLALITDHNRHPDRAPDADWKLDPLADHEGEYGKCDEGGKQDSGKSHPGVR
jgi:hypothetical protein